MHAAMSLSDSDGEGLADDGRVLRLDVEQVRDGKRAPFEDVVVVEQELPIVVNGRPLVRLQCLPGRESDLAVGFLVTAGVLDLRERLRVVEFAQADGRVLIQADLEPGALDAFETRIGLGSGCAGGLFAGDEPDALDCRRKFDMTFGMDAESILTLMREFRERSQLFAQTGGVHAAALVGEESLMDFAEDIGRHNAIDKVIGGAFRLRRRLVQTALLTSGRLSLEIVLKARRAGIPMVVSPSAPTAAAVEAAKRSHIGVVGFARGRRMNLYAAGWRVRTGPEGVQTVAGVDS